MIPTKRLLTNASAFTLAKELTEVLIKAAQLCRKLSNLARAEGNSCTVSLGAFSRLESASSKLMIELPPRLHGMKPLVESAYAQLCKNGGQSRQRAPVSINEEVGVSSGSVV